MPGIIAPPRDEKKRDEAAFLGAGQVGSRIAREHAGHAEVWRGNSKTSRERHRDRFGAARRLFYVVAEATTYKDLRREGDGCSPRLWSEG